MCFFMQAGGRDIQSVAYCGVVRRAPSCLELQSSGLDLRPGDGVEDMVVEFISDVQIGGFMNPAGE
jgi:hypothetical protein